MKNKSKLVETYIHPIVRYGLEAASFSKAWTSKIDVGQNDIIRHFTACPKQGCARSRPDLKSRGISKSRSRNIPISGIFKNLEKPGIQNDPDPRSGMC